jgi:hypothetical protein
MVSTTRSESGLYGCMDTSREGPEQMFEQQTLTDLITLSPVNPTFNAQNFITSLLVSNNAL